MNISRRHMAFLYVLHLRGKNEVQRLEKKGVPPELWAGEIENANITVLWGRKDTPNGLLVELTKRHENAFNGPVQHLSQIYRIAEDLKKMGLVQDYLEGAYKGRFALTHTGADVAMRLINRPPEQWPTEFILEAGKVRQETGLPRAF